MSHGIAISTYFGPETHRGRLNVFLTSIYSLLASGFDGRIVVVDDASPTDYHLNTLRQTVNGVEIIKRKKNTEIAACKNKCLSALSDCDYTFLADDDMIYNGRWWDVYINASQKTGIGHFCYYVPQVYHNPPAETVVINEVEIIKHTELNGCMMFLTQDTVKAVGGFLEVGNKNWLEHVAFTSRCVKAGKAPFFCDVGGARNFLRLNKTSYEAKSFIVGENTHYIQHRAQELSNGNTAAQYNRLYAMTDYDAPHLTANEPKWIPIKKVLDRLPQGLSVIDLGCGRGWYLRKMKSLGHTVFGVEQAQSACKKYLGDIPHVCSNIKSFLKKEITDGLPRKWDVLMNTDVIEHLPENEIDWTIKNLSKLSDVGLYGITNSHDPDEMTGEELHLCIHNREWWTKVLERYYDTVEFIPDDVSYKNEYFLLFCKGAK